MPAVNRNRPPPAWQRLRDCLEETRMRIQQEITHYPPPIPACDAHFNFLLEERARVVQILDHLQATAPAHDESAAVFSLIAEYVRMPGYIDDQTRRKLSSCLSAMRR